MPESELPAGVGEYAPGPGRRPRQGRAVLTREQQCGRATFYALWLRGQGYDPDEACELVRMRYPRVKVALKPRAERAEGGDPC